MGQVYKRLSLWSIEVIIKYYLGLKLKRYINILIWIKDLLLLFWIKLINLSKEKDWINKKYKDICLIIRFKYLYNDISIILGLDREIYHKMIKSIIVRRKLNMILLLIKVTITFRSIKPSILSKKYYYQGFRKIPNVTRKKSIPLLPVCMDDGWGVFAVFL